MSFIRIYVYVIHNFLYIFNEQKIVSSDATDKSLDEWEALFDFLREKTINPEQSNENHTNKFNLGDDWFVLSYIIFLHLNINL